MISIVLPVHNECANLAPLFDEIDVALGNVSREIIAIDDSSTDGSREELRRLKSVRRDLRIGTLERHAGQSAAFLAGFDMARGETVVTMDADGQNDPADIPELLRVLERDPGLAAVIGYRRVRSDSVWKRFQSRVANMVRNVLTRDRIRDTGCSMRAMRREVLGQLPRFDGMHRFFPTLIRRVGGKVIEIPVSHRPRMSGVSKYGMWNRGLVALRDAFGVRWLGRRALRYEVTEETD